MCLLMLLSLYADDLLKYKDDVKKTCFQRGFEFIKKNVINKSIKLGIKNWIDIKKGFV